MPRFAANLTMLFTEYPVIERFDRAAAAGFTAVEFLFPYAEDIDAIRAALDRTGLELILFNLPVGDFAAGDRGMANNPAKAQRVSGRRGPGDRDRGPARGRPDQLPGRADAGRCPARDAVGDDQGEPALRGRRDAGRGHHAARRAAQPLRRARLLPADAERRVPARRGGRPPQPLPGVRRLPRPADGGEPGRDAPGATTTASATSRSPTAPAATNRAPARSTTPSSSRRSTRSATTAGSAWSTSPPARRRIRSAGCGRWGC